MRRPGMSASRLVASAVLAIVAGVGTLAPLVLNAAQLAPQSSNAQMVTVTVTPHQLTGAESWEFDVTFDTHTQPLADDLTKSAFLVDAAGKRHAPTAWRGDAPGGHHRKGVLVFAPLEPRPAAVELELQRVGEPAPRRFTWRLQ